MTHDKGIAQKYKRIKTQDEGIAKFQNINLHKKKENPKNNNIFYKA